MDPESLQGEGSSNQPFNAFWGQLPLNHGLLGTARLKHGCVSCDKSNPQPGLDLPVLGGHKGNSLGRQALCLLTFKDIQPVASCRDPGERWK